MPNTPKWQPRMRSCPCFGPIKLVHCLAKEKVGLQADNQRMGSLSFDQGSWGAGEREISLV